MTESAEPGGRSAASVRVPRTSGLGTTVRFGSVTSPAFVARVAVENVEEQRARRERTDDAQEQEASRL